MEFKKKTFLEDSMSFYCLFLVLGQYLSMFKAYSWHLYSQISLRLFWKPYMVPERENQLCCLQGNCYTYCTISPTLVSMLFSTAIVPDGILCNCYRDLFLLLPHKYRLCKAYFNIDNSHFCVILSNCQFFIS